MNAIDATILGLVEGITEYLPVSSTGHLIIASSLLSLAKDPATKAAVDDFNIVIQGGAILAVLGLYFPRVVQMLKGLIGKDPAGLRMAINIVIAFLPAAALGIVLHKKIKELLFQPYPVLAALFLGGVWMIWLGMRAKKRRTDEAPRSEADALTLETMSWKHALAIGCFQVLAMWPGTSRSMMTIAGGTTLGLKPKEAAEFSFLLGLPTLGAACLYDLYKDYKHAHETHTPSMFEALGSTNVIIGILVATISAAFAVRWLVTFLNKHGLAAFGWYRVALTIVLGALMATHLVTMK